MRTKQTDRQTDEINKRFLQRAKKIIILPTHIFILFRFVLRIKKKSSLYTMLTTFLQRGSSLHFKNIDAITEFLYTILIKKNRFQSLNHRCFSPGNFPFSVFIYSDVSSLQHQSRHVTTPTNFSVHDLTKSREYACQALFNYPPHCYVKDVATTERQALPMNKLEFQILVL